MKKRKLFRILVELKRKFIDALKPSDMENYDGKSFTRKRVLTFDRLLTMILRCCPFSLQIRSDDFFSQIGHKEETVSKQAVSKSRTNLDPEIVRSSFLLTTKTISSCDDLDLFKGKYRLCAVDGSDVVLDNSDELLAHFGGSGANKECATAMVSLCYDPLNNLVLDGMMKPYGFSEREAFYMHIDAVSKLPIPKGVRDLYLADRGYPSKELFADLIDSDVCFIMRVRSKFNTDFDSVTDEETVTFLHNGKKYQVRVLNITIPSGEKEVLVTNLSEADFSRDEAGKLYFERWGIETKFESLKEKLELENMSGRRVVTTYQDFWAKLDLANMMAALEYETDQVIKEKTDGSGNKYMQRTNENRLITKFSDRYLDLLTVDNAKARDLLFTELVSDITRRPVEVKPGRQFPRKQPRKKKFCDRRKHSLR